MNTTQSDALVFFGATVFARQDPSEAAEKLSPVGGWHYPVVRK